MSEAEALEKAVFLNLAREFGVEIQRARKMNYKQPAEDSARRHYVEAKRLGRCCASRTNNTSIYSTGGLGRI